MSDPAAPPPLAPAVREPGYTSRQSQILAVTVCCMVLPTLIISLRLLTRLLVKIQLWWDDYCVFIALLRPHGEGERRRMFLGARSLHTSQLFCYGANLAVVMTIKPGLGRHVYEVTPDQSRTIIQALFAHQLFWTIGFGLIYCSILFLYTRLFPNTWLSKLSFVLQIVATVWTLLALLILVFQCSPVSRFWDPLRPGHCIKQSLFYTLFGIITMLLITALFFLPTPIIWKLQLTKRRKGELLVVFSLGAFVCVASVVRVIQVVHPPSEDPTWNLTTSVIWSCLELNIGLMSACIPSLLPLLKILTGKRTPSTANNRTGYESRHDPNPTKSNKFSRMVDDPDDIPLQKTIPQSSSQTTFEDNVRLVDPKPNEILVTNHIVQSHELKPSPSSSTAGKDQPAPPTYSWSRIE